jgi:small conductance mechanosensitive channel
MELNSETASFLAKKAIDLAYQIVPSIIYAVLFFLGGKFLINKVITGLTKILYLRDSNSSLNGFLIGLIKSLLIVSLIIGVATIIGVPISSFLAILGAAGLAIGLALQGSLSNFAGGVLILLFKPYQLGDNITCQNQTGTVRKIDVLYTHLTTFDNKEVIIPNGNLANSDVVNFSSQPTRRVDFAVGVAYGTDLKLVKNLILEILKSDIRVLSDPQPFVGFNSFGGSSLDLVIRAWVKTPDYWDVYFEKMEAIKEAFEANQIEIPYSKTDVYHHYPNGSEKQKKAADD